MANEIYVQSCERANGDIAQTGQTALFTVSDYIRVHAILGVVETEAIGGGANAMKVLSNPTTGADVDLCVATDIDADVVGTMYTITGDFSDALIITTSGAVETTDYEVPFIVAPGTIDMHCAASKDGKVTWTLIWSPVNASASVVAA